MSTEKLRYGIVAAALGEDPRRAAAQARSGGFAGLQFEAYAAGLRLPELSLSGRREFRHLLASHQQQLVGLRLDVGAKGFSLGADVDRLLSQLDKVMEAAAGLSAPLVCVDVGPLPAPPPEARPKPRITPEQAGLIILPTLTAAPAPESTTLPQTPPTIDPNFLAQVDAAMIELGRRADRFGVTLALRSELAGFAALQRLLAAARCPWFGIDLDPVAVLRDSWDLDEVFSRLGPLIRHVRARDAQAGAEHRTKPAPIGQGSTNWGQLLANLDAAGYHGWISIDPIELPNRSATAVGGLEFLRRLRG